VLSNLRLGGLEGKRTAIGGTYCIFTKIKLNKNKTSGLHLTQLGAGGVTLLIQHA
jgi:hypothetical protein